MRRAVRVGASALVVSALLAACSEDAPDRPTTLPAPTDTLVDAAGRRVVIERPVRRIVSLVPSATETLLALGAADRIVGRTDFDDDELAHLPSVGGGLHPSLEVLVSLRPDLVVRFAGESDVETPARLDRIGVTHLAVRPERIEDVWEMIDLLGDVLGREAAADSIRGRHVHVLDSIRTLVAGLEPIPVAFTLGGDPPFVAGPGTFADELVRIAGGENVFGDLDDPWSPVGPETFVARDPEVILVVEGGALDPRLSAGAEVREVDPLVQLPGPRLDEAALAIARLLRPGLLR